MTGPDEGVARVAYLINQYPKISHTFIRTEILSLEALGVPVVRVALRGWDEELVDPADVLERDRTTYLLRGGVAGLARALLKTLVVRPAALIGALLLTIRLSAGSNRGFPYHLAYLAEACMLRDLLGREAIRHVHAHFGSNAAEVAMLASRLGGGSFSFTVHGPEEFDLAGPFKLREKVEAASFVAAVSSFGRSQLYRSAKIANWPKIEVVHCGLGDDYLTASTAGFSAAPRLVCVGRLCEQKGQLVLVEACALLAAREVDFHVMLVGDGEMRGAIELAIATLGLGNRITLTGWYGPQQIRDALDGSKGLVLPSFAEGLPVVIMESLAVGRPVVTTYVAGIPELVRDGREGYLVPAGDAVSLADAMERLLTLDEQDFRAMGDQARQRARERHSGRTEAAKLAALFRSPADR